MLGVKLRLIPLDENYQMDIAKLKKAINKRTCLIVVTLPNEIYGTYDDIQTIAALALSKMVPLHVDANIGGLLVPFYQYCQINIRYDFLIKGITSISVDLNSYGMAPNGISLLMFRDRFYRKHHYFLYPRWPGGYYISPSFAGSRTSSMIAAAYMIFMYNGKDKLIEQVRLISKQITQIKDYVKKNLPKINILGDPKVRITIK